MRTLKKTLALVLVLAMMFSLCITASAYTDDEKIEYADAVELLSALKVIEGYPDGSFKPQNTLNRAEAAVIIAKLNGYFDEAATTPTYTDMAGYGWANSAVAFCENEGIVNGTAAGIYEPGTTLTGYMFIKMLAVSMGIDADEAGMTGPAWQIGITKVNKELNLTDGIEDFDMAAPITREQAAQCAFNALLAVRDGVKFAVWHDDHLHYFDTEEEALAFAATVLASWELTAVEVYTTLGYEVFGLTGIEDGFDKWGNPYYGWVAGGKFITKHDYAAIASYNTAIYEGKLYADLAAAGVKVWDDTLTTEDLILLGDVYVDGAKMLMTEDDVELYKGENALVACSGNGTSLKVYDTASGVIVVAINEYIGVIAETYKANAITGADAYAILAPMCTTCTVNYKLPGEYTKGDVYLYNICHSRTGKPDEVILLGAPETVSGKLTKTTSNAPGEHDDVYTIDGTDYLLSKHNSVIADQAIAGTWYVDSCGNLMALKAPFTPEYTVAYLVEYDAENYWAAEHSCVVQEASEVFTFYDPATGETYKLNGDVKVKTNLKGEVYTEFVTGNKVFLNTDDEGIIAADALDLKNLPYNTTKGDLSLGLVVYMTNEDGEVIFISDKGSLGGEIAIATVNGASDFVTGTKTAEPLTYYVDAAGNVYDEIAEYYYQYNTKYVVETVTESHSAVDYVVDVTKGDINVYTAVAYTYDVVTVTTSVYVWDKTAGESGEGDYVLDEELSGTTSSKVNYKYADVPSIGVSNEGTVFYYDALTKISNKPAVTSAIGFANAKTQAVVGEVAIDLTKAMPEVIAVAQYKDAAPASTAPTTEYVYVGSDYDFDVVLGLEWTDTGYIYSSESYAVATGLYIDGVSVGEVELTIEQAFMLDGLKGELLKVTIDKDGNWIKVESVGGYIGDVTAIYYGNILKIGAGFQMNLAADCVVVRVNDLYGTVAVGTVAVGDSVVFADYNAKGEVTLLYVTNIDD